MSSYSIERVSTTYPNILPGLPSSSAQEYTIQKRMDFVLRNLDSQVTRWLDVGCGVGSYLDTLSLHTNTVIGMDLKYGNLREAYKEYTRSNVYLSQMLANRLALANDSMDAIILIETLEHLTDGPAAIAEMSRVFRPVGFLFISVPNALFPFETHPVKLGERIWGSRWGTGIPLLPLLPRYLRRKFATVRSYHVRELRNLLANGGFNISRIDYLMPSLDTMQNKLTFIPLYDGCGCWPVGWKQRSLSASVQLFL